MKKITITVWNFKRSGVEIQIHPPVEIGCTVDFLKKAKKYVPDMARLLRGAEPEEFDTRTLYIHNSPCELCEYAALCYDGSTEGLICEYERENFDVLWLSPSHILKYEMCPRQWAYSYLGYRYKTKRASRHFGDAIHAAVYARFRDNGDPVETFVKHFDAQDLELEYTKREGHKVLLEKGKALMDRFNKMSLSDLYLDGAVSCSIEERIIETENVAGIKVRYKIVPDIVFEFETDKEVMIVEVKTSYSSVYTERWIRRSDQLNWYAHFVGRKKAKKEEKACSTPITTFQL